MSWHSRLRCERSGREELAEVQLLSSAGAAQAVQTLVALYWAGGRPELGELAPSSQLPAGRVQGSSMRTKEVAEL
jgi:hypothetical protein